MLKVQGAKIHKLTTKYVAIALILLMIIVSHIVGYFVSIYFSADRLLARELLNIITIGVIAIMAIYPVILFQITILDKQFIKYHLNRITGLFKRMIFISIVLLLYLFITISASNILTDSVLFANIIMSIFIFLYMVFLGLFKTTSIVRDILGIGIDYEKMTEEEKKYLHEFLKK